MSLAQKLIKKTGFTGPRSVYMPLQLHEYNALQLHQKAMMLERLAFFADCCLLDGMIYSLYVYSNYYIEVTVDLETNYLLGIAACSGNACLDKYLVHVSLEELLLES